MRGVAKTAKPPALKTDGFAFLPTNADFREGMLGLSSRQWEEDVSQPCVPHASS
jgi:hypothetical protein